MGALYFGYAQRRIVCLIRCFTEKGGESFVVPCLLPNIQQVKETEEQQSWIKNSRLRKSRQVFILRATV
ncbi:hypothetical protein Pcar_3268 [Syntrophotalea carbinolica DSM 2380]|uniref:Uncharacterized protein n=1 Tax=Syntrophotalea carbinolica (strain DSM 2380 / NBRC 103641 / GraBd1) TaxID=338963 RepID=Q0C6P9_SYNC1|nr:hypothetical protein Pcar_3268 [Syntrophotalea carbinolica DSM 2380]